MAFFSQHGCTTNAANAKYNSRAAKLYREKIKSLATQATRRHGTEVLQTNFMKGPFYTNLHMLFCPRQKQSWHIEYFGTSGHLIFLCSFTYVHRVLNFSSLLFLCTILYVTVLLTHSCGLTARVHSLQRRQKTSRWISSACIHRYSSVFYCAISPVT